MWYYHRRAEGSSTGTISTAIRRYWFVLYTPLSGLELVVELDLEALDELEVEMEGLRRRQSRGEICEV